MSRQAYPHYANVPTNEEYHDDSDSEKAEPPNGKSSLDDLDEVLHEDAQTDHRFRDTVASNPSQRKTKRSLAAIILGVIALLLIAAVAAHVAKESSKSMQKHPSKAGTSKGGGKGSGKGSSRGGNKGANKGDDHGDSHGDSHGESKGDRKALVVATWTGEDSSWLEGLPEASPGWRLYRYISDNSSIATDPDSKDYTVARSDGFEALPYLTFITDNYNNLPDVSVYIHGHQWAWHQPLDMLDVLSALNLSAVEEDGYVSLRWQMLHGCTYESMFYFDPPNPADRRVGTRYPMFWNDVMKPTFGTLPEKIGRRCCAQFAVSKETIRERPRKFYMDLRMLLESEENEWKKYNITRRRFGQFYEMSWHMIFGKPAVYCPSKAHCLKTIFSNALHCDGSGEWYDRKTIPHELNCTSSLRGKKNPGEGIRPHTKEQRTIFANYRSLDDVAAEICRGIANSINELWGGSSMSGGGGTAILRD